MTDKMILNAIEIVKKIIDNGFEAYFVGGCVRDSIMNKPAKDIDITTNALPEDIQKMFDRHIDTGLKHGTVSVREFEDSDFYEVTTYRIDGKYDDGRHPDEVTFTPSLVEDLARRDFTMNAIAKNPITNEFVDPFNGRQDLENGIVHCVGIAKDRFMEDPLRVLRAMRFAIKYGFDIEASTKEAMHDIEVLNRLDECISKERITEELRKMLTCGNPIHDMFMEFSDIIGVIIPEIKPCIKAPHNSKWHKHDIYEHILCVVDACETTKFEIKLAALLHDIGKPASRIHDDLLNCDHFTGHPLKSMEITKDVLAKDLRLSTRESERVLGLVLHHDNYINPASPAIKRFIANTCEDLVKDWVIIKKADLSDHICPEGCEDKWNDNLGRFDLFVEKLPIVIAENSALKVTDLKINGSEIMNVFKLKPGPVIGSILKEVLEAVINEEIPNEKSEIVNYIIDRSIVNQF